MEDMWVLGRAIGGVAGAVTRADDRFGVARMDEYEKLRQLVAEIEEDVRKAEGGNKAAGTRVRKAMQDVKNAAQEVRKKVLEMRDDG